MTDRDDRLVNLADVLETYSKWANGRYPSDVSVADAIRLETGNYHADIAQRIEYPPRMMISFEGGEMKIEPVSDDQFFNAYHPV